MEKPSWFKTLFALCGMEIIISYIVAVANPDEPMAFWVTLICLYAAYLLIWIKNKIAWLVLRLFSPDLRPEVIVKEFEANGLPRPHDHIYSAEDYFSEIVADEEQPVRVRLYAATVLGQIAYPRSQFRLIEAFAIQKALRRALIKYSGSYPRSGLSN